jgi:hypothetical protein
MWTRQAMLCFIATLFQEVKGRFAAVMFLSFAHEPSPAGGP